MDPLYEGAMLWSLLMIALLLCLRAEHPWHTKKYSLENDKAGPSYKQQKSNKPTDEQ